MKRLCAALLFVVAGCVEAPFEHTNPFDTKSPLSMQIIGGVDTATVAGQTILYQLVSTPALAGYEPEWETDTPSRVISQGQGRFVVITLSIAVPTTVIIRARFGARVVERPLVIVTQ